MKLALVIGDPGDCAPGETISTGSERTFIADKGAAHIGSLITPHSKGDVPHPAETLVDSANSGRTIIAGTAGCSDGAKGSEGDTLSAKTTSRTYIS